MGYTAVLFYKAQTLKSKIIFNSQLLRWWELYPLRTNLRCSVPPIGELRRIESFILGEFEKKLSTILNVVPVPFRFYINNTPVSIKGKKIRLADSVTFR